MGKIVGVIFLENKKETKSNPTKEAKTNGKNK